MISDELFCKFIYILLEYCSQTNIYIQQNHAIHMLMVRLKELC